MTEKEKSFWSSLPGVLTGIAAVITAITGLYVAISNNQPEPSPQQPPVEKASPKPKPVEPVKPVKSPRVESTPAPASVPPVAQVVKQAEKTKAPFPEVGPLVDCELFPTVNTVTSLMSWSNYYHQQIIAAQGSKGRAASPCNRAIDYRGMAHCKAPDDPEIGRALRETLELCRQAGIEWQEIQHTTIIGDQ